jgi:lysophospholipase L1-like esterase
METKDRTRWEQPPRRPPAKGHRLQPAGEALIVMLIGLALWAVVVAPRLEEAAENAPFGARRTAALVVLRPLAAINRVLGISWITDQVERALGDDGGARAAQPPAEPLPTLPPPAGDPDTNVGTSSGRLPPLPPLGEGKLRIVVVGDSLAVGLSQALSASVVPARVRVVNQGRLASGLARPDAFDWPAEVERIGRAFRPHVVVVMLGSNDAQPIGLPRGRVVPLFTRDWVEAYRRQIARLISAAARNEALVVWAGLPPMRERFRNVWAGRLNEHFELVTSDRPGVELIDTWEAFAGRGDPYRAYLRDARGRTQLVRAGDGVHLSAIGYRMLATLLLQHMREDWDLDPRTIGELVAPPA